MPSNPSNKTNITRFLLTFILVFYVLANIARADEMYISYSHGIDKALIEIVNTINELPKTRSEDRDVDWKLYKNYPISFEEAEDAIDKNDLHLMVVLSSEIENRRKKMYKIEDRKRKSILVSFIAITIERFEHNNHYISKVTNNSTNPLIYYKEDDTANNMINDVIFRCAQGDMNNRIVIKPSLTLPSDVDEFCGIVIKKIHFNDEIVGKNLFIKYDQHNEPLSTIPIADPNNVNFVKCIDKLTDKFWKQKIPYRVITPGKIEKSFQGLEYFRDYSFIQEYDLESSDFTPILEKIEHVVLLSSGEQAEANRIIGHFNKCLYDRYYNLEGDYDTIKRRSKEPNATESIKNDASKAKIYLEKYVKGFYLLLTDSFPTASYSRLFLLPDKTKYYHKIGNKYRKGNLTDKLYNGEALNDSELEALTESIIKYKTYIEFREEATIKGHYDWWLLYALERYALLKRIEYDHYYVLRDSESKVRLKNVIEAFHELDEINKNILSQDKKYWNIIGSETNDFSDFRDRIKRTLEKLESQL